MDKFISGLKILPRWAIIILDLSIIAISVVLAYALRFNFNLYSIIESNLNYGLAVFLASGFVSILISRTYSGIVRYTTIKDGIRIFYTILLTTLGAYLISYLLFVINSIRPIPLSIIIITAFITASLLFIYRVFVKYLFSYYTSRVLKNRNVLIFGAGVSGSITKQVIENDTASEIKTLGFLEDDANKIGKYIDGVRIYDAKKDLIDIIKNNNVDELIISIQNLNNQRKNEIVDIGLRYGLNVRSVPSVDKWIKGELSLNQIRNVKIEDLLGRESIILQNDKVIKELSEKTILITGAAGSIGSEVVRQILMFKPKEVVLVDQAESALYELEREISQLNLKLAKHFFVGDITNESYMATLFEKYKPHIVYHAAAYKHVPLMEKNVSEAIRTNILGTKILADLSVESKVQKFVMISTDKAVNPTSVMGCTKRIAEMYVQALYQDNATKGNNDATNFVVTRFGNVLGSNGSVIPFFKKQIENGGPITVTHPDVTRFFMTIPEACQLVLEASTMGKGGEIFIFDMGKSIKIIDLAKKMIRLSGLELGKDIEIVYTGLREGEKLYEELLTDLENSKPTYNHKIMIADVLGLSLSDVSSGIAELQSLLNTNNDMEIVKCLKMLVPDYKSQISKYGILDR